jgi:peptidoglycan/LPS O-acetylase OafA/YrhL
MASAHAYWAIGIVCVCVLLLGAALGYAYIERPGIALGKHIVQRLGLLRQARRNPSPIPDELRAPEVEKHELAYRLHTLPPP